MSCGLEHLSNCHGERELVAGLLVFLSAGGLWVRMRYDMLKTWFQSKWEDHKKQ